MSKYIEMLNKRAAHWEAMKNFAKEHTREDGTLSAEDEASYQKMEADLDRFTNTANRLQKEEAMDAAMAAPVSEPVKTNPKNEGKKGTASKEYTEAFWNMMHTRREDLDREVRNSLTIGTDSKGGYLAPDEFEKTLIRALEEQNVMRRLAKVIKTEHGNLEIPVLGTGGTAEWTAEEQAYHESDMEFSQITLGAHKLTRILKVSEELANDSVFDLQGLIAEDFGRAFGVAEEEAFLTGDGNGKPMGLLNDTHGIQDTITAAAAAAVTFDEMFDLYYKLKSPYRGKAAWLMNDQTVKILRKLKDGNQQYIWQPAVTAGAPDTILGRPVYTSPFMPTAASGNKAIVFGDFSYYWIADRTSRNFRRLDELYATTGQIGYLASQRVDARLVLPEAMKAIKMA